MIGLPLTLTAALTTGEHYRAAWSICHVMFVVGLWRLLIVMAYSVRCSL